MHFKRWQVKVTLWLQALNVFWACKGRPEGELTAEQLQSFTNTDTVFVGCVLSVLVDRLCDVYLHIKSAKKLRETLNTKFGASDTGSKLYVMENFHDIKMVENRSVVEQAHDIQCVAKELELLNVPIPDPFVACCIIRNFATSLKHKRTKISVESLIASLMLKRRLGQRT